MLITVLDTETTLHSAREKESATPHDPDNEIVWLGYQHIQNGVEEEVHHYHMYGNEPRKAMGYDAISDSDILVGQNIKFDLHYLRKNITNKDWHTLLARGLRVWDTQLAEYILTGQQSKMASLDGMAKKYGLPIKDDRMKEYWDKGVSTESIPATEIIPYLKQDVTNTRDIFYAQVKEAKEKGMLTLIQTQMDALLATQEMEFNGMYVDIGTIHHAAGISQHKLDELNNKLTVELPNVLDKQLMPYFNQGSGIHLAHLLFGTPLTVSIPMDTGTVYKSGIKKGMPKMKKEKVTFKHDNNTGIQPSLTPTGRVQVDAKTLNTLANTCENARIKRIAQLLSEIALTEKEISTYLRPAAALRWRHDCCIHHSLNHTITSTGRLSSSKPNLQNVPREGEAKIKDAFTSRFKDGKILEADYSQLEVIGLAHLTQDKQLMYDVSHGVDMHLENASTIFGIPKSKVTKEQRRQAKVGTFQLQYGAGATTIHEQSNLSMEQAKDLVNAYYSRYPGIKDYHKYVEKQVTSSRQSTKRFTDNGLPSGRGVFKSVTGREYVFNEYDAPAWTNKDVSFSPTEMKNYPVQGFATADIVPMILGKVLKNVMLQYTDKAYMINTVHDSILFDIHPQYVQGFIVTLSDELSKTAQHMKDIFDIDITVPLGFDIELGTSWGNKKKA